MQIAGTVYCVSHLKSVAIPVWTLDSPLQWQSDLGKKT
jgi:hypothetical protein